MQEQQLFEYAVIRIVPQVEREEFINVGVVLYCKKSGFLKAVFELDENRLSAFSAALDLAVIRQNLAAFEQICLGGKKSGPIGILDTASRFRWLTATRSTVLQTSKVHPGFCFDPEKTLFRLHKELVL
ncbi:DUF3037 domain-containing protein [Pedobacter metabolipauper]|uniref:DUF3037 family protein n=1 Tax=Pedobacter metabolipauper TaxID=425513 RepID=A0A4R6T2M0_9SPHI|nr:DUF3037 domain-containing protein [Pedobacter metabolipauper]TDQ11601.1 Protein of unknown function (DUF3037) [Pedobacter metabolipauper]